jgi:hypothetical protein
MTDEPVLLRELVEIRDTMKVGFAGVHSRLDVLNGRIRSAEGTQQVLTDRSERNERHIDELGVELHDLHTGGCAVGKAIHEGAVMMPPWWTPKKVAAAGVGGSALVLGLIELGKAIVQAWK